MTIRNYISEDKTACINVFKSNCPKFFDASELEMFEKWLDHQVNIGSHYSSPTYTNSEKDAYYVIESENKDIVACGGFYVIKNTNEARLAWGMVHADHHHKGYGTALYKHRYNELKTFWPQHTLKLGTSQHTSAFYEKMGMKTKSIIKQGYGDTLDQYEMEL